MKYALKNITVRSDRVIISLLIAIVIIVPLFFDPRLYSVFDLSKVTVLYLLTIAILVIWLLTLAFKSHVTIISTSLDIPILAYISFFIISSVLSINPLVSLFGAYKRFEGLTATVCYIFLFYTTINFVTTRKRLYSIIISIIAGAVIASCYGIAQHFGFDIFKWSSFEARRVFSTFGNPVFFSAYLVMVLPLAVILFFNDFVVQKELPVLKKYILWIFFAVSLIIYTAFWLTNTRACFVALLGVFIPFLFFIYKKQFSKRHKFIILIVSFILIGMLFNIRHETSVIKHFTADIHMADNSLPPDREGLDKLPIFDNTEALQRPWITTKLSVDGSSFSRIFQYMAAIKIIKDHLIFGIGPDTIGIVYQNNLAKVFSLQESDNGFPFPRQDRIHNDILDTTVTRGIIGLFTYLWLLAAFGIYMSKNYKNLNKKNRLLILGLLAGMVCYLIQNQFSFGNTPIVTLFWIMMGLCISIIHINTTEEECLADKDGIATNLNTLNFQNSRFPNLYKWLYCGIVLTIIGFVFISIIRTYKADVYFEYGRRILTSERNENPPIKIEKGLYLINYAVLLNPYETFYRDELCRTYLKMAVKTGDEAWIQKVYEEANNALKLVPQHHVSFFYLGIIYQILAEKFGKDTTNNAIVCYKKAIEMDTFQAPFHSNLAALYSKEGNLNSAIEEYYQAYLIRPDEINYLDRLSSAFLQKDDLDRANIFLNKTTILNPAEPGNYNKLGVIFNKKGMHEEAVKNFKKALELQPGEPVYTHNLASTLASQGKYTEAEQIMQTFNKAYPDHPNANIRALLATMYFNNHDWEKVISECEQIIRMDNKSAAAYKMSGISYYNLHQYELAKKMFDQALVLNPDDQTIKNTLNDILRKKE